MNTDGIYRRQRFGMSSGLGRRCGLVLVDFVNGFVDESHFGGPAIQCAVDATVPLSGLPETVLACVGDLLSHHLRMGHAS